MGRDFEANPDFDRQIQNMVEHQLLRPLADAVADDARRMAPVDTGELQDSIRVEVVDWNTALVVADCDHAAATELGSAPHTITVRRAKVLANSETGQVFGKQVRHPGTPAQPFLRPALYRERAL
jgi:hypothetical protein